MAKIGEAMGMRILSINGSSSRGDLDRLLAESDIISLHCPLNNKTVGLIGEPELSAMKPGALLVNYSRGPVIQEAVSGFSEIWRLKFEKGLG